MSDIDSKIGGIIIDQEVSVAESNRGTSDAGYTQALNILRGFRTDPMYEWQANVQIPYFSAHYLTRQAIDAQFLNSRDYADIYLEETGPEALAAAGAQKELVNRTLNARSLQFPMKYMRIRAINDLNRNVVASLWWERTTVEVEGEPEVTTQQDFAFGAEETPTTVPKTIVDRIGFDVLDPNDVFWDDSYAYSLQDKRYVTIRFKRTLSEIKANKKQMGYDEDAIKRLEKYVFTRPEGEEEKTEEMESEATPDKPVMLYDRHGIFPVIVKSLDATGYPKEIEHGYDENGQEKEGVVYIETTYTIADANGTYIILRFQPQKNRTDDGEAYRPLIRSMAYLDPRRDGGFSDASFIVEVQEAMSDFTNITMDRALLATMPTLLTKKYGTNTNDDYVIGPGMQIPLDDPSKDLTALEIKDTSPGAFNVIGLLKDGGDSVAGISEETTGMPGAASTTATANYSANLRTNTRMGLRDKMFEFTFLTELYWMIGQMTAQYALPETVRKLIGSKFKDFDPDADFYLKPVSASLEPEHSKSNKINNLNMLGQQMINSGHPDGPKVFNTIINAIAELMGDDMKTRLGTFDEGTPFQSTGENAENPGGATATNQSGVEQTGAEQAIRG